MNRATLLLIVITLAPAPAFAHAVVDLGVVFVAPQYVAASSTVSLDVIVTGFAYDSAYGAVVDISIDNAHVTSADPAWRCTTAAALIECAAEELVAGPHPVHLDVKVPASGTLQAKAVVTTIGSFDPNNTNDNTTLTSRVYDPAQCQQSAPAVLGDFQWGAVPGATSYDVFYAIDGEMPHLGASTTEARTPLTVAGGDVTWFVRAHFDGCPDLDSASSSFQSTAAPLRLSVITVSDSDLVSPKSAAVDGSVILVTDPARRKIYTYDPVATTLTALPLYGDIITSPATLDGGIAVGPGDYLYDADLGTHTVRFAFPGQRYMYFAAGQAKNNGTIDGEGISAQFNAPSAVAVDAKGNFFITDSGSNVVRQMNYSSAVFDFMVVTIAGAPGQRGFADGKLAAVRFNDPEGVTIDASDNVYICDRGNHIIRKIAPDQSVTTFAGSPGVAGHQDGDAATALFNRPFGIVVDAWGNLYVTEEGSHDIRKIAPNGRVTTVAGDPDNPGASDGIGSDAHFDDPALLAIGTDGTLWIPDMGNGRLVHAAPSTGERRHAVRR